MIQKNNQKQNRFLKTFCVIAFIFMAAVFLLLAAMNLFWHKKSKERLNQVNVMLEGGSGKATVESPAAVIYENGNCLVRIIWSSPNYDYMIVEGEKYYPVNESGNSTFEIPLPELGVKTSVLADTTAMSKPHEIEYFLTFSKQETVAEVTEAASDTVDLKKQEASFSDAPKTLCDIFSWTGAEPLEYATGFVMDYYENEENEHFTYVRIRDDRAYLVGEKKLSKAEEKALKDAKIIYICEPKQIYLVATQVLDMLSSIDAVGQIRFSSLAAKDWYFEWMKQSMAQGDILYAGKYSAPDYELILNEGCDLVIENTMIYHNPQVLEKLEGFGIPVLIDCSSYETDPMGKLEWVKLYGVLCGHKEESVKAFAEQTEMVAAISESVEKPTAKIAYFFIASNGEIKVRNSSDYIPRMIEMAGGSYAFNTANFEGISSSAVTMQLEEFYVAAKDADYIIYNSSIVGELDTLEDLISKNEILLELDAVKQNHVYCTRADFFQASMSLGTMIVDINKMINGDDDMEFLYQLK